ncbi:antibiotic biosynthesis monooxygenase [Paenibacillus sp. CF384]|uniref:antibiotic biosynthesis monooxygenase n=1 Tax=Paenibacillus sp. CF384 TaxID=1884382 RepID=UPI002109BDAC|nr:antibiotic biosynthesis monooxygenase [Paenibacillus sp. CF384]
MIVVENRIEVRAGFAEAVLERFKTPKTVHTFPGFVRMDVLHAVVSEETEEIRVCTTWEKEEDFQAWANSDSFRHAHTRREGAQGSAHGQGGQGHGHGQGHGGQAHGQGQGHGGQPAAEAAAGPIVGNKVTIYQVVVSHLPESAPVESAAN